jgi:uncharacterized protein
MYLFARLWRHLPEFVGLAAVIWVQFQFSRWLLECEPAKRSATVRRAIRIAAVVAALWVSFGVIGTLPLLYRMLLRRVPRFSEERRGFIRAAGGAFVAAPFAVMAFGILVQRKDFRLREVKVPVAGLPKDLDGLRIAQLSDIHLSPFLSEQELARAVAMANETRPHLAVVTGDLITSAGDPLAACLGELSKLRADAGILGCLGNHEIYAHAEDQASRMGERVGVRFLRQEARALRFGNAMLNVAGVDYQKMGGDYLEGAEQWIVPGATNILLSHNPDVFDAAAGQGWDLTISGHTHGGQVTVEILHQTLNAARFFTPYVYGLYRQGRSSIWVTRGIGTVGVPARLGAPPEVALIRLCAT